RPLMSAMNPTPQESFSSAGSNKPKPDAFIALTRAPRRNSNARGVVVPARSAPPFFRSRLKEKKKRLRPRGEHLALEAAFLPLRGPLAACYGRPRRALVTGGRPRVLPESPAARWFSNWDSKTVLCRTWQIPGANTSVWRRPGADFCACPQRQVDHGMGGSAMGAAPSAPAIQARSGRLHAALSRLGSAAMHFASDNTAGVHPAILEALAETNRGYVRGYGNDDWTTAVERRLSEIFERDAAVFLVPTGTASNALALAHVSPPWGAVFCHAESHIATDECGAPEWFGGGLKLVGLAGEGAKIASETLQTALAGYGGH